MIHIEIPRALYEINPASFVRKLLALGSIRLPRRIGEILYASPAVLAAAAAVSPSSAGFLDIKVILPIDIDMRIPGGPDMGEITVLHGIAFLLQLLHDGRHVDRIPDDDRIGHQIEATGLVGQHLAPGVAELALVGNHQGRAQVVQRLAFVELAQNTAPLLGVGIPAHDMEGSHEAAILLEGRGQGVLLRIGLELLDQQRGRHPAELHGARRPATSHPTTRESAGD